MTMHVDYPFHYDRRGRTAETGYEDHVRDMIEQVLFTAPGERVNRPDLGSGVLQLVFAPNSPELAATTQHLLHAALQQWLGDEIVVDAVAVESEEATLHIRVDYVLRRTQQRLTASFQKAGP
jgi:phage baseplate assembly protein W